MPNFQEHHEHQHNGFNDPSLFSQMTLALQSMRGTDNGQVGEMIEYETKLEALTDKNT
jgi:hypothetical protein